MRELFRSFDREGVRYLLIGGQAAILYGAAQFTQDMDLWIAPTRANTLAFLRAIARLDARVHRLTPPPTLRWIRQGHGFHFLLPQAGRIDGYLDVMGCPPRVGTYSAAARRSSIMESHFGQVRVVGIPDLVELKKTNRPGDYEVISALAMTRLDSPSHPTARLLSWAIPNLFRVEDLAAVVRRFDGDLPADLRRDPALRPLLRVQKRSGPRWVDALQSAGSVLDGRMAGAMRLGRAYWLPKLEQLRELRSQGALVPPGTRVQDLVRSLD